jgi:hypothetical protein
VLAVACEDYQLSCAVIQLHGKKENILIHKIQQSIVLTITCV